MYDDTVTQIAMVLLETYLLNALLLQNVSVPICTIHFWNTTREPKVTDIHTNQQRTKQKELSHTHTAA